MPTLFLLVCWGWGFWGLDRHFVPFSSACVPAMVVSYTRGVEVMLLFVFVTARVLTVIVFGTAEAVPLRFVPQGVFRAGLKPCPSERGRALRVGSLLWSDGPG